MTEPEPPRRKAILVLGACGHWWAEVRPAGAIVPPEQPRACTAPHLPPLTHSKAHPASAVGVSPQGLPLVPVVYVDSWNGQMP